MFIIAFLSFFRPKDLDLSWIGSLNLFWLLDPFIILLFLSPLLDLDWSPFLLRVPVTLLGLLELSTLLRLLSLSLMSYSSSAAVLSPSKYGCIRAYLAVSRSFGSIIRRPFISSRPSLFSFPAYFFSIVSGLVTSGNLKPINLGFFANYSC